ncbi:MAG: S9 family peptidase [Chloroflexota bacterium]
MTQKRPLQARDLYQLALISDPQISPDGSRVAYVRKSLDEEKNEYITNIYVTDRHGNVTQFTSGDKDSAPRWSPDGTWLAFLSARKEKPQIYLLSTSGGESTALTERKFGAGVPFWSPDGRFIAFAGVVSTDAEEEKEESDAGKDQKKVEKTKIVERATYKSDGIGYIGNRRRHLFLIDVEKRTVEQLTEGDHHNDGPAWSPDGEHIAFHSNRSTNWDISPASDIYIVPRSGGPARTITSGSSFEGPVFSPDGGRIAFIGTRDQDDVFAPMRLYSTSRSGSDLREELGDWDAELGNGVIGDVVHSDDPICLCWRKDGIYFLGTERGEANIYRSNGTVQPVTRGRHTTTGFSYADDGTLAFTCSDATHLMDVYVRSGDDTVQLTHENDAFLEEVHVVQPHRFSFTGANDESSEGWLLPPRGHESGKHPLLVYIHGGPQTAYGENLFFEFQFLASQGFGVFFPNIHGSSSYGRDYQTSIWRDWGNLDYQDVMAGTREALSHDWVDDKRVGILGGSYGGYMTNWVLGHDSGVFSSGIT